MLDLQSLNLCQINLNKKVEQVEKIWKQIVAINSTHNKARNIYAKYISILRNDLTKAQQIVENKYVYLYIYIYIYLYLYIYYTHDIAKI